MTLLPFLFPPPPPSDLTAHWVKTITEWLTPKEVPGPEKSSKNSLQNVVLFLGKMHSEPGSWKQALLLPRLSENHTLCPEASWRGLKYSFSQGEWNSASYTALGTVSNPTFGTSAVPIVWARVRYTCWGFWIYLQGNQHNAQLIFRMWLIQSPTPYSNYIHSSPTWAGFCLNAYGVNFSTRFMEAAESLALQR